MIKKICVFILKYVLAPIALLLLSPIALLIWLFDGISIFGRYALKRVTCNRVALPVYSFQAEIDRLKAQPRGMKKWFRFIGYELLNELYTNFGILMMIFWIVIVGPLLLLL